MQARQEAAQHEELDISASATDDESIHSSDQEQESDASSSDHNNENENASENDSLSLYESEEVILTPEEIAAYEKFKEEYLAAKRAAQEPPQLDP